MKKEIISKASKQLGISEDRIKKVYWGYWRAIKEYIQSVPITKDLHRDTFEELRPNVNIVCIGHLYSTYDFYRSKRKIEKYKKWKRDVKNKEDQADV